MGRKILRTLRVFNRNEIIIALTIVVGVVLTITVVFMFKNGRDHNGSEVSSQDISVQNEYSQDENADQQPAEELLIEVATSDTKVESTEETTKLAVKENAQKGYMNRCVFLGDSRTVAMVNFGLINDDSALAQIGISHPSFSGNTFINNAGKSYTLKSYLASHQAPVIYIALGVNGINDPDEDHYKKTFVDLIDKVMEQAPNSNIVLMAIGPVDDKGMYSRTVQNSWIEKYNDFLLNTAKEKHIFYLDISEILTGPDGQVRSEYDGGDGLHYSGSGCQAIFDYIVSHPVPGISDDGEYKVKYIKPNPKNTKVTMDDGSGIDEEKLLELLNLLQNNEEAAPTETPSADPAVPETPTENSTPEENQSAEEQSYHHEENHEESDHHEDEDEDEEEEDEDSDDDSHEEKHHDDEEDEE